DQHHTGDVTRVVAGEATNHQTPVRLPHQNVRWLFSGFGKRALQLQRQLGEGPWLMPGLTPGVPSPIVAAYPRLLGNSRLDQGPDDGEIAGAAFQQNCRRIAPGTVEMNQLATDVDEFAGWLGCLGEEMRGKKQSDEWTGENLAMHEGTLV